MLNFKIRTSVTPGLLTSKLKHETKKENYAELEESVESGDAEEGPDSEAIDDDDEQRHVEVKWRFLRLNLKEEDEE